MTSIIYGSTIGNTESAANAIAERLSDETQVITAGEISQDVINNSDRVLLGSSTWGEGDLQDDWDAAYNKLKELDFSGKKVGFFGTGDQEGHPDTFGDALGTLYAAIKDTVGEVVGKYPTDTYEFDGSTALIDGEFIGLLLDDDNQPELTEMRIDEWVESL